MEAVYPLGEAQEVADHKAKLAGDALKFSLVVILLLTFLWPVGVVVMIIWGPRYVRELYSLVIEPELRERFLRQEVEKQVHARLSRERRELENEHSRSLEELSAQVAHEIRNPITAAKSLVQQMEEDPKAGDNVEYARVALEELTRVERSVNHLLRYARDEDVHRGPVSLAGIVDSAVESFRDRIERSGVEIDVDLAVEGRVDGDAEKLRRVVINLLGNALEAVEGSGQRPGRIDLGLGENLAGDTVWLRVADDGPGLAPDETERIFSPFHTSKPAGTGLGLAISRKLVEAHGGQIEAGPSPSGGAEFVVTLPKDRPGASP